MLSSRMLKHASVRRSSGEQSPGKGGSGGPRRPSLFNFDSDHSAGYSDDDDADRFSPPRRKCSSVERLTLPAADAIPSADAIEEFRRRYEKNNAAIGEATGGHVAGGISIDAVMREIEAAQLGSNGGRHHRGRRRSSRSSQAMFSARRRKSVGIDELLLTRESIKHRSSPQGGSFKVKKGTAAASHEGPGSSAIERRRISYILKPLEPHQYTMDPTVAWEMMRARRPVKPVRPMALDAPLKPDHVRFVAIACSHGNRLDQAAIPPGDVLLVAGDFTSCGLPKEIKAFSEQIATMKHTYKLVIAGNHELTFDSSFMKGQKVEAMSPKEMALKQALQSAIASHKITNTRHFLTGCTYLEDTCVEVYGLKIYGTPWQPTYDNWAFNIPRGQPLLDKWEKIPVGVDVLMTHTPPVGHGDRLLHNGGRAGCVELLNSVCKRVRPKYHVFGHIHEGYGCTTDGYTKYINCCMCNAEMTPQNPPVIFDVPLPPEGPATKKEYLQRRRSRAASNIHGTGIFAQMK